MKGWTVQNINDLRDIVKELLSYSVGQDSANKIANVITLDVAKDISETAEQSFNDDDVRLAIGRVLEKRLSITLER